MPVSKLRPSDCLEVPGDGPISGDPAMTVGGAGTGGGVTHGARDAKETRNMASLFFFFCVSISFLFFPSLFVGPKMTELMQFKNFD